MAEGFAKTYADKLAKVESAALEGQSKVNPVAIQVMEDIGIILAEHTSKKICIQTGGLRHCYIHADAERQYQTNGKPGKGSKIGMWRYVLRERKTLTNERFAEERM